MTVFVSFASQFLSFCLNKHQDGRDSDLGYNDVAFPS